LGAVPPNDQHIHPSRLAFHGYRLTADGPVLQFDLKLADDKQASFTESIRSLVSPAGAGALRDVAIVGPAGATVWCNAATFDEAPEWRTAADAGTVAEQASLPAAAMLVGRQDGRPLIVHLRAAPAAGQWQLSKDNDRWHLRLRAPIESDGAPLRLSLAVWRGADDAVDRAASLATEEFLQTTSEPKK
jgi:hypothetical protein